MCDAVKGSLRAQTVAVFAAGPIGLYAARTFRPAHDLYRQRRAEAATISPLS
jgi:hypothetical protein